MYIIYYQINFSFKESGRLVDTMTDLEYLQYVRRDDHLDRAAVVGWGELQLLVVRLNAELVRAVSASCPLREPHVTFSQQIGLYTVD